MKIKDMLETYAALDSAGQERLLEEFFLHGRCGDAGALFLAGYLSTPVREDLMSSAAACDFEAALAYAEYCSCEYGRTSAGRRKVYAVCFKGRKSKYAPLLNKLGVLVLTGCGCVRSLSRAEKFFRRAAALGSGAARENLELLLKIKEDPAKTVLLPAPEEAVNAEVVKLASRPERTAKYFADPRFSLPQWEGNSLCHLKIS